METNEGVEYDPSQPEQITVDVRGIRHRYDRDSWPLQEFLGIVSEIVAAIPEEHRQNAIVKIDALNDPFATIEFSYTRLETSEDIAARLEQDRMREQKDAKRERALYENLRKKYGG